MVLMGLFEMMGENMQKNRAETPQTHPWAMGTHSFSTKWCLENDKDCIDGILMQAGAL